MPWGTFSGTFWSGAQMEHSQAHSHVSVKVSSSVTPQFSPTYKLNLSLWSFILFSCYTILFPCYSRWDFQYFELHSDFV